MVRVWVEIDRLFIWLLICIGIFVGWNLVVGCDIVE